MKNTFTGFAIVFTLFGLCAYSVFVVSSTAFAAPSGLVSITFDDGNRSQYQYVAPILKASGQKAVFYVNSAFIGKQGYMTWPQLAVLKASGHEIGGHTLQHIELPTVNQQQKDSQVAEDFKRLAQRKLAPQNFALPYGAYDNDTTATVAKTYDSMRAFKNVGLNIWPYNKYLLYVRAVTNQTSLAEVEAWIQEAVDQNEWLVLVFHEVLPKVDPADTYSWTSSDFSALMKYLNDNGIKAKTIQDALAHSPTLISNGSFENGLSGWTTDSAELISVQAGNNGSYPTPKNVVRLAGSPSKNVHLFGSKAPVSFGTTYGLRAYTDSRGMQSGEVGFYIDEFDASGAWISGKWLGAIYNKNVIDKAYVYTPSSSSVKTMAIQVYVDQGTSGNVIVDNVEFFAR
jgi:peptidoglycan/xylan/chitin deacetylase (PgdA/CDA1 family)